MADSLVEDDLVNNFAANYLDTNPSNNLVTSNLRLETTVSHIIGVGFFPMEQVSVNLLFTTFCTG